jgi:hypothetical protein
VLLFFTDEDEDEYAGRVKSKRDYGRVILFTLELPVTSNPFLQMARNKSLVPNRTFVYALEDEARTSPVKLPIDTPLRTYYVFAKVEKGEWKLTRSSPYARQRLTITLACNI